MSSKSEHTDLETRPPANERSLISIAGNKLLLAAAISFAIFTLLCLAENSNEAYFTRWYAKQEFDALSRNLHTDETGRLTLKRAHDLAHYWSANADAYGFRIWDRTGAIIDAANMSLLEGASPVAVHEHNKPDRWQRKISEAWFDTLSGQRVDINGQPVWFEVATRGDPDRRRYGAIYMDFIEDVVVPVLPTFFIAAWLSLYSLRRALQPVRSAARRVRNLDPTAVGAPLHIPATGLPQEVAVLVKAVNDLLHRTERLVQSQSEFIGRAAHQLKTPLGVMLLEAGKIDDPRAERLQKDLMQLGATTDRLLELARMQGAPPVDRGRLDLVVLVDDVVFDLATLAQNHHAQIEVVDLGAAHVCGDYMLLREALGNLVINAILHHPDHARIVIACGPGPRFSVEDDGRGIAPEDAERLFKPFARLSTTCEGAGLGLALVQKIVELHRGRITVARSELGGAAFHVELVRFELAADVASIPMVDAAARHARTDLAEQST